MVAARLCFGVMLISCRAHALAPHALRQIPSRRAAVAARRQITVPASASGKDETDPGEVSGLRILKYPDPRLRAPNVEITDFDDELKATARRMFELMYAAEGVGLAAPQVGINKRLMVYNEFGDPKKWLNEIVLVNPRIVEKSLGRDTATEGCLSFPGMDGPVERAKWIKIEAQNLKGKKLKKKFTGFEARLFQHEYDHLEGVVYIDHLDNESLESVQQCLDELVAGAAED